MRELHGVIAATSSLPELKLKQKALLFDKFVVLNLNDFITGNWRPDAKAFCADLSFLTSRGVLSHASSQQAFRYIDGYTISPAEMKYVTTNTRPTAGDTSEGLAQRLDIFHDFCARMLASKMRSNEFDAVGLCLRPLPSSLSQEPSGDRRGVTLTQSVLRVTFEALPVPDEQCSWQDILDFKTDLHDKQWGFRRFLKTLVTKQQTEFEIRDEIEWMVNEYTKAMNTYRMKASQSFIDVFVVSPLEIMENLIKLNFSKIAKGILAIKNRQVELMEAEMKAPGRECAYVFDARKRFGSE